MPHKQASENSSSQREPIIKLPHKTVTMKVNSTNHQYSERVARPSNVTYELYTLFIDCKNVIC